MEDWIPLHSTQLRKEGRKEAIQINAETRAFAESIEQDNLILLNLILQATVTFEFPSVCQFLSLAAHFVTGSTHSLLFVPDEVVSEGGLVDDHGPLGVLGGLGKGVGVRGLVGFRELAVVHVLAHGHLALLPPAAVRAHAQLYSHQQLCSHQQLYSHQRLYSHL